jgi:hypothetical protein
MFKSLKAHLGTMLSNLSDDVVKPSTSTSISKLMSKDCKLPISDILKGKYPNLAVTKLNPVTYAVSETLPKTGTKVVFKVFDNGQIGAKNVYIGANNSSSKLLDFTQSLYNRTIKDGKQSLEVANMTFNYKRPLGSFQTKYVRTPSGFGIKM